MESTATKAGRQVTAPPAISLRDAAPETPVLVTIPFSHFCEKGRWALDHAGVPYQEAPFLPFFHVSAVKRAGGKRQVPILATPSGIIRHSTAILRHADEHLARAATTGAPSRKLLPNDAVGALVRRFDDTIGVDTRCLAYFHLLQHAPTVDALVARTAPEKKRLLRVIRPLFVFGLRRALNITKTTAARSLERLRRVLDETDALLTKNRRDEGRVYLAEDRFTGADLTLAALLAPVLYPFEMEPMYGRAEDLPSEHRALVEAVRQRPSGVHALRCYREHRFPAAN